MIWPHTHSVWRSDTVHTRRHESQEAEHGSKRGPEKGAETIVFVAFGVPQARNVCLHQFQDVYFLETCSRNVVFLRIGLGSVPSVNRACSHFFCFTGISWLGDTSREQNYAFLTSFISFATCSAQRKRLPCVGHTYFVAFK